ncbi:zinc transporter ZIP9-like protein [Dinothrombium tinctorium]|uniref:Zinc transporter ZIP9-like protein n=1 Tax=Dinothrombium tinctorium TaxID=1965070 RepID=A0A3S4RLX8_9ACAR|nr:zinc transporter ZIP9-like protein [Dinothrombium tinctorium]
MEQFTVLTLLSFSMLFGSYFAGTIPLVFTFSESKVRLLTILGSGILVGTALAVIIPEGVNTIYESAHEFNHHLKVPTSHPKSDDVPHSIIGVTLVLGFVFMLLIDQIANKHTSNTTYTVAISESLENGDSSPSFRHSSKITATIGLIVHAAADGVALGASATTSHTDVEMVVFLAIMLHKAPAAFGLVTFLMHEGLEKARLKKHLIAFSLSAPMAAFITYFGISQSTQETLSSYNATGVAMLFSAGTFLYVATVHVLPEITQHQQLRLTELFTLIAGALLPSLMTVNHHH